MCKIMVIGIGAAGNKAVLNVVEKGVVRVEDTLMVNSTQMDIPSSYTGESIVLTDKDTGSGKERNLSKQYLKSALSTGKFNIADTINKYESIIVISSVEGGTGSGSTPKIAQLIRDVYCKTPHIIAITGFEEDPRGLYNTVEFFKEIPENCVVETISNKAFLEAAYGNKFKAEQMANDEIAQRIRIMSAKEFIDGEQNIDATDILKLINTMGYMTIEKCYLNGDRGYNHLVDVDAFNRVIKSMIYSSKSLRSENPSASRIGIILNLHPLSENAIDFEFTRIKEEYGNPYEVFIQKQWDEKTEYIAFIISGMKMPIDEVKATYARYVAAAEAMNHNKDSFSDEIKNLGRKDEDSEYDLIKKPGTAAVDMAAFLKTNF